MSAAPRQGLWRDLLKDQQQDYLRNSLQGPYTQIAHEASPLGVWRACRSSGCVTVSSSDHSRNQGTCRLYYVYVLTCDRREHVWAWNYDKGVNNKGAIT